MALDPKLCHLWWKYLHVIQVSLISAWILWVWLFFNRLLTLNFLIDINICIHCQNTESGGWKCFGQNSIRGHFTVICKLTVLAESPDDYATKLYIILFVLLCCLLPVVLLTIILCWQHNVWVTGPLILKAMACQIIQNSIVFDDQALFWYPCCAYCSSNVTKGCGCPAEVDITI